MSTRAASGSRLAALRRRVDTVDRRIVRLLGQRQRLVAAMRSLKSRLREPAREAEILRSVAGQADDPVFVRRVYAALLAASRDFLRRVGANPRAGCRLSRSSRP